MSNDLTIYDRRAHDWWDEDSTTFRSLRSVSNYRIGLIDRWLGDLSGKWVCDLGCGGGLLSEPLKARGARRVIGIDLSHPSLVALRTKQKTSHGNSTESLLIQGDVCSNPFALQTFDIVLLADVLEHIANYASVIAQAATTLKAGGHLYVSTINRNWLSAFLVSTLSESFGLIPRDTHDPRLFIRPAEIVEVAEQVGLSLQYLQGEQPAILPTLTNRAIVLRDAKHTAIAYSALFMKS